MRLVLQVAGILVAFPIVMGFVYNETQAIISFYSFGNITQGMLWRILKEYMDMVWIYCYLYDLNIISTQVMQIIPSHISATSPTSISPCILGIKQDGLSAMRLYVGRGEALVF